MSFSQFQWIRSHVATPAVAAVDTEGPGIFGATTCIHRVNAAGGKAPATAGAFAGPVAQMPCTADNFFYREASH